MDDLNEIIKGCQKGKPASQKVLYDLFAPKMYGVCLQYCQDRTEAEDCLQEGFIKVFTNIKKYRFEGSFEGWVRRIIVNTALDKYRKQNILQTVDDISKYSEDFNYDDVISKITSNDLLKFIHELTPKYKVVFISYAIEGYSHKEISDMLGISIGTSKSNLSRARQILQDKINKYYTDEGKIKLLK